MNINKQTTLSVIHDGWVGIGDVAKELCSRLTENGFSVGVEAQAQLRIEIAVCRPFMCCDMTVSGADIRNECGGAFSAWFCTERLAQLLCDAQTLEDGVIFSQDAPTSNEHSDGSNIRIMTSNILAERWSVTHSLGVAAPVEQRAEIYAATLAQCTPDAVGVQETDAKWISVFPTFLERLSKEYGLTYTWKFYDFEGRNTLTTVLYRSDRFELVDSGIDSFSIWKTEAFLNRPYHMRLVEWVLLKDKNDADTRFILINTHWGGEDMAGNVTEEVALVDTLRKRFGIPVFCTGDFNARETSAEHERFLRETGGYSTRELADKEGTLANRIGGCGKFRESRENSTFYIDHIFGIGSYKVLKYETVLGYNCHLSDHSPHIADIKI